jgi:hypothetical protein
MEPRPVTPELASHAIGTGPPHELYTATVEFAFVPITHPAGVSVSIT